MSQEKDVIYLTHILECIAATPTGSRWAEEPFNHHLPVPIDHQCVLRARSFSMVVTNTRISAVGLHQEIKYFLPAELAGQVKRRVAAVSLNVDVNMIIAGQQLDHVQIAMFGCPMQCCEARGEISVLGQPGVLHEHFHHGVIISLR